jgi:hypothetical protein
LVLQLPRPSEANIRTEDVLLLACSRLVLDETAISQIQALLKRPLDWNYILWLAQIHGVSSLLFGNLSLMFAEDVPTSVLMSLKEVHRSGARHSLALTRELLELLDLFEAQNIPAVPLKGPVLAVVAYGDLSLRRFEDLDILVRKEDVLRVKDLLARRGYHAAPALSEWQEALHIKNYYVYSFVHDDDLLCVEIHYRFRPQYFSFALDPKHVWMCLEKVSIAGRKVSSLSPEDMLLFLCAHGASHYWSRLAWLCDVAELIRHQQIAWEIVLEQSRKLGSERIVLLGLLLVHNLLGTVIPEGILEQLQIDRSVKALANQVCTRLFLAPTEDTNLLSRTLFHLRVRERWQDRMRYCLRLATLTTLEDWALFPLPGSLSFIYTLIRPIRLLVTYGLGPLKRRYARTANT